jgi:uncharacterized coiled-coil DUF342 family protein
MSEDITRKLTVDEKLDQLLSEMTGLKSEMTGLKSEMAEIKGTANRTELRLSSLETKVDERLHDTRPMWQAIHAQTEKLVEEQARMEKRQEEQHAETQQALRQINHQLEELAVDQLRVKGLQRELTKRVALLEDPQQKVA